MAKEMIVSVNGREKKIAILEDGKVTEFYIERGEENTGVVGNIYKGRVQRVLPGMQSAFVDIGLERDAFLYVSDFFDEEEEFERIVLEKTKKADVVTAEKVASERLQQARLEREQAMEAAQERAEPLVSRTAQKTAPASPPSIRTDSSRNSSPLFDAAESPLDLEIEMDKVSVENQEDNFEFNEDSATEVLHLGLTADTRNDLLTTFSIEDSGFERVVDEDMQSGPGDIFKEARIQERLTDQVRAVEFEIEPTPNIEVGSFALSPGSQNNFQRIDDGEDLETDFQATTMETSGALKAASGDKEKGHARTGRQRRSSAKKGETELEIAAELIPEESISEGETDDEQNADNKKKRSGNSRKQSPARNENEKSRGRRGSSGGSQQNADAETAPEAESSKIETINEASDQTSLATERITDDEDESSQTNDSRSTANMFENKDSVETVAQNSADETDTENAIQTERASGENDSVADAMTQEDGDAEASVDDLSHSRSEFAVRRGGRRRRRRPQNEAGGEENANAAETDETGEVGVETEDVDAGGDTEEVAAIATQQPAAAQQQRSDNNRGNGHQQQRGGGNRDRGDRDRDRDQRRPPTITDLLREGQEILVQIAKEPIAKKGARITSHIALPGRYLVYMPTIEHVGVSRKIESGNERNRLRHLIQKIRNEEDVPSGGFIVRTAGIGIPEQNLREDARYLVRTWQDVRKQAEKSKSPALVHQDLDLVQRILRDQLSEDFAAIRVDDEAEYLRTVEFINRIQPRMTNRVKLYTREEPIMENYGVQEEIEKAIKPRVWLKSGGYLVINQTEALVSIDVNTGKFVGKGATRLEDTITKTNIEAVEEIARQIRLRDLGGIIVLDLIDMEDRKNRQRVLQTLQEALQGDKSPTKVLSFNDFGLIVMTRKRVKQSLERTLCAPCHYCQGAGLIKSPQTVAYEVLAEARRLSKLMDDGIKQTTLRVHPEIAKALRTTETDVLVEIEDYLGAVDVTSDASVHQEQFDFAFI